MTTPEQWPRVKEILGAALACEASKREVFLDEACLEDEELRSEVESLIAAYEDAGELSSPGWQASVFEATETVPDIIGPYRMERELGSGGMGQVWLAEQTEPVRRHVALKLIRADFRDAEITQRFLSERRSLALMNHPAIAKVFDAGATPAGQPYLVMEYVDGLPINEYCDHNKLPIPERLKLFQQVCDGVQHAHQKAIIHRDLKPSNILITEVDEKPVPRIIDFGVAKTISTSSEQPSLLTRVGTVVGTLSYMSPEQAEGSNNDMDTRSDVYSLGVILYELMAGELPLDQSKLTYYEMLRQLREQEAPRPSTRVRHSSDSNAIAENRRTTTPVLTRQLRGDADAIALTAIEKDRERRYATPSELSADIGRYLRHEPVSAHSATFSYLTLKYIRRHRVGVVAATLGMLLIIGFAVAQTIQLRITRRERDRADRITEFMTNMFKVSDPSESRGNSITARELLDQSSHRIETGLGFDATVQSQLMQVMAKTYTGLGLYKNAHDLAERTVATRMQSLGPDNPKTIESMTQLAEILDREGHVPEAEASLRKIIDRETRVLGREDPLTLETKNDLAWIQDRQAHYVEAETIEREIIPIEVRRLGPTNPQIFRSENNLCIALKGQRRFADAEKLFRIVLESERSALGDDHPYVLVTMHNLANMLADQDRHAEAETLYRGTLTIERRVLGSEHPDTADTMVTLANTVEYSAVRRPEAESIYRKALTIELKVVGPDHAYTTRAKEGLANLLNSEASDADGSPDAQRRAKQYAEAQQLLEEVLETRKRTIGPDDTDTLLTGYNLADVLFQQRKYADSEKLARKTLESQIRVLDANDPDTFASKELLAKILLKEGRFTEAEAQSHQAFDAQLRVLGPGQADTQQSLESLTEALAKLDRYAEAQALWMDTIARVGKADAGDAWLHFAEAAAITGRKEDALNYVQRSIQSGFNDVSFLRSDAELSNLHNDPRYQQILSSAEKQTAASQ